MRGPGPRREVPLKASILAAIGLLLTPTLEAAAPEECELAGIFPGMSESAAAAKLGSPTGVHRLDGLVGNPAGSGGDPGLYYWESADRSIRIKTDDNGEVVEVALRQKRGTTKGPFGVRIGADTVAQLIRKVGREYFATYRPRCEGDHVIVEFSLGCVPEGSTSLFFEVRVPQAELSGLDCGKEPDVAELIRTLSARRVSAARVAY